LHDVSLSALFRKQHIEVRKGLEFERVAAWVKEEHRGLFARFAPKEKVRLNHGEQVA
jgi:hypothetical protein